MTAINVFLKWILVLFKLVKPDCYAPTEASTQLHTSVPWMNLTSRDLQNIIELDSREDLKSIFQNINVIREVDTPAHAVVREYINNYLTERGWSVQLDSFTQNTVIGSKTFHNIIGRLGSSNDKRLVLACHYDSKKLPGFVGSIDSAMPCAILLKMADILTSPIVCQQNPVLGLQLVFFDGEEAFREWTATDSIYGARHLAEKWSEPGSDGQTELSKIALLVLLDLIGAKNPTIPNYGYTTQPYYDLLASLEQSMRRTSPTLFSNPHSNFYFRGTSLGQIQDDHIPFYQRGVPILHLIPTPFPNVWHTVEDNEDNISWEVSVNMLNLMIAFVQSSLHLVL